MTTTSPTTPQTPAPKVLLVMAMQAEADPVIDAFGLAPDPELATDRLGHRRWCGNLGRLEIALSTNGVDPQHGVDRIGTNAAVLNTLMSVERDEPGLVISTGTSGGYRRNGAEIGSVYLAAGALWFHDRRIELPGFGDYALGGVEPVPLGATAERLGFEQGPFTTGDSLDESEPDRIRIAGTGAVAKDMEAAAVGVTCQRLSTPVTALRCITDLVDDPAPTVEQFSANLAAATERLAEALLALVRDLEQHPGVV